MQEFVVRGDIWLCITPWWKRLLTCWDRRMIYQTHAGTFISCAWLGPPSPDFTVGQKWRDKDSGCCHLLKYDGPDEVYPPRNWNGTCERLEHHMLATMHWKH